MTTSYLEGMMMSKAMTIAFFLVAMPLAGCNTTDLQNDFRNESMSFGVHNGQSSGPSATPVGQVPDNFLTTNGPAHP
jgi:hypothetical protein